ncbi:MAG: hypothetical protein PWP21_1196 [Thermosediminibacterales bacterium]|nr:hypothetical protein [Thermosediminibacterales bacterium]
MSGIAGQYGPDTEKQGINTILEKMKHRGPDGVEVFSKSNVVVGQAKLSLIPENETDSDFKEQYLALDGDLPYTPEQLLKLFNQKGPEFINELNGPFALIIGNSKTLFAARDPLGVKPLYYGRRGDNWYFASEIKGLSNKVEEIKYFPPGYYFDSEKGFVKYSEDIRFKEKDDVNDIEKTCRDIRESVIEAVEEALNENIPTGILLSGGIDSSVIAAAAAEVSDEKLQTFSVGLEGSEDLENARKVADYLGTEHHEYTYSTDEMMDILSDVIYYLESFDAPLVHSSIANFIVSRMAKQNGIKMVLCGEGSDELFAGYDYLKKFDSHRELNKELENLISGLHNGGLQRVDRMANAHSLEAKVPFLNEKVVDLALTVPAKWKIKGEEKIEKWILRKAFSGLLPDEILWRKKAKFHEGTGSSDVMKELIDKKIDDAEFIKEKQKQESIDFLTKEEMYYYNIFCDYFPESAVNTVNRTEY